MIYLQRFNGLKSNAGQEFKKIIDLSNNNRKIYHMSPPFSRARDLVMKRSPQALLQKRMDWLYGWEPPK